MRAVPPEGHTARDVLRAVRRAVDGPGPAVLLGGAPDDSGDISVAASGAGSRDVEVPPGTAAVVVTSGSTGYPKSVVLGRNALVASAFATRARIGEGAWLLALPPTYVAGLQVLVRSLMAGHEPAVVEGPFQPRAFAAAARGMASSVGGHAIARYTSLVPAQLVRLIDAADDADVRAAIAGFEAILVGGQMLPEPVRERAESLGARIVRTYGSSETSGGCVYDAVPLDGVRVRIEHGEVQVSGPMLATEYLGDPERTEAVFVRDARGDRWYRTGDAGAFEGGRLRVTGRLDNVIVSGGVNVSLDRVERIARALPGLASAVVVGVPDERWGEASVVVVPGEPSPEDAPLLERVREAVAAEIGSPARPARLLRLAELPELSSGKPDRRAIRARVMSDR